jgi:xanthine dehydrogenase YagS FAD-binding subunit
MAIVHDCMPSFDLYRPTQIEDALALATRQGNGAWIMAGGLDSLERFKDRIIMPDCVIDLSGIDALRGIHMDKGDMVIGSMTTLTEVSTSPLVRDHFPILAEAAGEVASPQIRNQGTLGGNISQDTRCWYYRGGWDCYRAGGNICYANTTEGLNREHAIFGIRRCAAVSPSDTAPVLVALEATLVIQNGSDRREIPAQDFFVGPDIDITRLTALGPGDLLTQIRIPQTWAKQAYYFEKVRDRPVWDFPLVNIAAVKNLSANRINNARFVLGAVAARPWRLDGVEKAVAGQSVEAAAQKAPKLVVEGARPLVRNEYKTILVKNLVKRAIVGKEDS